MRAARCTLLAMSSTEFRSSTVAQLVQAEDGHVDMVVLQVNAIPMHPGDDPDLATRMALGTVNGYVITMSNAELVSTLRYLADQIEANS